jgi:hypothetical protein
MTSQILSQVILEEMVKLIKKCIFDSIYNICTCDELMRIHGVEYIECLFVACIYIIYVHTI